MTTDKYLTQHILWQTVNRGTPKDEYQIYLDCADDGNGGDITRSGAPLKTFDEWMNT
ncbi:hypothetical protein LCGC14_0610540 [marine sediment metagenome]|uniref:Uncharacterized protein n=1 Tax=marine sediment metagenome TaxID=412755 RepID=A0A0F9R7Y5_9ZZZZ